MICPSILRLTTMMGIVVGLCALSTPKLLFAARPSGTAPSSTKSKSTVKRAGSVIKTVIRPRRIQISAQEAEARGVYAVMKLYINEMCIKEVPFFLSLHRSFYQDKRIDKNDTLVLGKIALETLLTKATLVPGLAVLATSAASRLDSMMLFKSRENRGRKGACNAIMYLKPGSYEIPKTGACVRLPAKIAGSIHYSVTTGKMIVYLFSGGIKLELPGYAKALSLGMIGDMDIGIAELDYRMATYTARLLYATKQGEMSRGWSFNVTECNKIRTCGSESVQRPVRLSMVDVSLDF